MVLSGLNIAVDAHHVVRSANGNAVLTQGSVLGLSYVIDLNTLGTMPAYGAVDAAFTSGTKVTLAAGTKSIPAASFNLVGLDLTTAKIRNVIVANTQTGVTSYQLFQITFNSP